MQKPPNERLPALVYQVIDLLDFKLEFLWGKNNYTIHISSMSAMTAFLTTAAHTLKEQQSSFPELLEKLFLQGKVLEK